MAKDTRGARLKLDEQGRRDLGAALRELRQANGVSRAELADAVGTSEQTIAKVERGVNAPSMALLERLAAHFGVGLSDLYAAGRLGSGTNRSFEAWTALALMSRPTPASVGMTHWPSLGAAVGGLVHAAQERSRPDRDAAHALGEAIGPLLDLLPDEELVRVLQQRAARRSAASGRSSVPTEQ